LPEEAILTFGGVDLFDAFHNSRSDLSTMAK